MSMNRDHGGPIGIFYNCGSSVSTGIHISYNIFFSLNTRHEDGTEIIKRELNRVFDRNRDWKLFQLVVPPVWQF